jgi:multiple sugar transport system permease protein
MLVTGKSTLPRRSVLRGSRTRLQRRSNRRAAGIMLAPWALGFLAFVFGPLIVTLLLAFTSYNVFSPPTWIGLMNFRALLHDPNFWQAWRVTLIYGGLATALVLVLALVTALLIFHARRISGFWRVLYYFPCLLAGASEAFIMVAVWDGHDGLVNAALHIIGIQGPAWLESTTWALPAVIITRYWTVGTLMLLFLGARSAVNRDYYEAAEIDGASGLQQFLHITFPMISPIVLLNLILGLVASLQAFTQVYILTAGGPSGSTDLISIYIYDVAFQSLRMGYGSAASWTLFMVAFALSALLFATSRFWVHYEFGGPDL